MRSLFGNIVLKCTVMAMILAAGPSFADPIDVTFSVSGSSGDYTYDFTVNNNLVGPPTESLYFFGVQLSAPQSITGSPSFFIPNYDVTWSTGSGSNIEYNNNWLNPSYNTLFPGGSLSGFEVHTTDVVAPTTVHWFAYTFSLDPFAAPYYGGGNFNAGIPVDLGNPGFEGVAGQPVPEPSSLALFGLGGIGMAIGTFRRKRHQRQTTT